MKILAIDLGKQKSVAALYTAENAQVEYHTVKTTQQAIHDLISNTAAERVVIEQRLSHIDLMPTLYELLHLEHEGDFQGASYASLLFGDGRELDRVIYLSGEHIGRLDVSDAVVYGDHKLILSRDGTRATLYDLEADPHEMIDISDGEPALADRLDRKLRAIRQENRARRDLVRSMQTSDAATLEEERRATTRALKALGYIE